MDEFDLEKIREIKKLKDFDKYIEYIKPKSDSIDQRILIDAWNFLIIENGDKKYNFDFNNDLGQPINNSTKPYINLDINNKLKKILLKHSILRKEIEFESLFEDYVYWFLHR